MLIYFTFILFVHFHKNIIFLETYLCIQIYIKMFIKYE